MPSYEQELITSLGDSHPEIKISNKTLPQLLEETGLGTRHGTAIRMFKPEYAGLQKAHWIGTALEFFHMLGNKLDADRAGDKLGGSILAREARRSLVLGLSTLNKDNKIFSYNIFAGATLATSYNELADSVKRQNPDKWISEPSNPDQFLPAVIDYVPNVVFFVPPHIDAANFVTHGELSWFIKNPKYIRKLILVVGAYDLINPEVLSRTVELGDRFGKDGNYNVAKGNLVISMLQMLAREIATPSKAEEEMTTIIKTHPNIEAAPKIDPFDPDSYIVRDQLRNLDALLILAKYYNSQNTFDRYHQYFLAFLKSDMKWDVVFSAREPLLKFYMFKEQVKNNQFINDFLESIDPTKVAAEKYT